MYEQGGGFVMPEENANYTKEDLKREYMEAASAWVDQQMEIWRETDETFAEAKARWYKGQTMAMATNTIEFFQHEIEVYHVSPS